MYVSLDIETGGLSHDTSVLQIAMVKDDAPRIEDCSYIDFIITAERYVVEPFAANLNKKLFEILAEGTDPRIRTWDEAMDGIDEFLGDEKYFAVGKNASTFDLPFLMNHGFQWQEYFRHRVLDVGSLYATADGVPSLPQIMERYPMPLPEGALHQALWDARVALVYARRALEALNKFLEPKIKLE